MINPGEWWGMNSEPGMSGGGNSVPLMARDREIHDNLLLGITRRQRSVQ